MYPPENVGIGAFKEFLTFSVDYPHDIPQNLLPTGPMAGAPMK